MRAALLTIGLAFMMALGGCYGGPGGGYGWHEAGWGHDWHADRAQGGGGGGWHPSGGGGWQGGGGQSGGEHNSYGGGGQ